MVDRFVEFDGAGVSKSEMFQIGFDTNQSEVYESVGHGSDTFVVQLSMSEAKKLRRELDRHIKKSQQD